MTSLALAFPDDLKDFIDAAVKSGQFAGPNELVANALYAYRDQLELEQVKLHRLRNDIEIGIDQIEQGDVVVDWNIDAFLADMSHKRAAAKI